jgi:hypothetical protein
MNCKNLICDGLRKIGAQPRKYYVSHVALVSNWEEQLPRTLENCPRVIGYAKNQTSNWRA